MSKTLHSTTALAERDPAAQEPGLDEELAATAREVLRMEAEAVAALADRVDGSFAAACRLVLECPARVVVTGMGKSGAVARKIAGTLAGTGTPAVFLHPSDSAHGDAGALLRGDVVLVVSKSGETDELFPLLSAVKRLDLPVVGLVGNVESTLARHADVVLDASVGREAWPLDLAPTASTAAAMALGDALAVALFEERGLGADDVAQLHPGGALGRRLLLRVADVMVPE